MSANQLAVIHGQRDGLLPAAGEFQTMLQMATTLYEGGLLPSTIASPQAAFTIIQKGRELRVPPMAALNGIYVVNGRPTCSAELMAALIYRDHGETALDFVRTDNEACEIAYRRRGWGSPRSYAFTMKDAERAGLTNGKNAHNWRNYPAAMLRARCISAVARFVFPDTIGGMYTPEELGAEVDPEGNVIDVPSSTQPRISIADVTDDTPAAPEPSDHDRLPDRYMTLLTQKINAYMAAARAIDREVEAITALNTNIAKKSSGSLDLEDLEPDAATKLMAWIEKQTERMSGSPSSTVRVAEAHPATEEELGELDAFDVPS